MDVDAEVCVWQSDPPEDIRPFLPFPIELVRRFLEVAAEDRQTAVSLTRVSKRVHDWITPVLYHTITIHSQDSLQSLHGTIKTTDNKVCNTVRRLGIFEIDSYDEVLDVISSCTRLDTLSIDPVSLDDMKWTPHVPWPKVRHLMVYEIYELPWLWPRNVIPSPQHPIAQNLTHFQHCMLGHGEVENILRLPRLTHFGYYAGDFGDDMLGFPQHIFRLLSESATLVMVVVRICGSGMIGETWSQLAQITDERLFATGGAPYDEAIQVYCEMTLSAGGTMWDDAEVLYKGWRNKAVANP